MSKRTVYFDRTRGGRNSAGHWITIVKDGSSVHVNQHATEALARASIGLSGGSQDPHYAPPGNQTGGETVED